MFAITKGLSVGALISLFVICISIIVFWPFAIIFALNTLFVTLSIPYSFWTWLSIVILQWSTFGGLATAIKNK